LNIHKPSSYLFLIIIDLVLCY